MILVWRELAAAGSERGVGAASLLVAISARLLTSRAALLPKWALLLVLLSCGRTDVTAPDKRARRVWSLQQHIRLVHDGVVNELPLVVSLFLVVNPDGRVFTLAAYSDDRSSAKGLAAEALLISERRTRTVGIVRSAPWSRAVVVAERAAAGTVAERATTRSR